MDRDTLWDETDELARQAQLGELAALKPLRGNMAELRWLQGEAAVLEQPAQASIEQSPLEAVRQMGFTGDMCDVCGSMQMIRDGTCLRCQNCGTTTGCN